MMTESDVAEIEAMMKRELDDGQETERFGGDRCIHADEPRMLDVQREDEIIADMIGCDLADRIRECRAHGIPGAATA